MSDGDSDSDPVTAATWGRGCGLPSSRMSGRGPNPYGDTRGELPVPPHGDRGDSLEDRPDRPDAGLGCVDPSTLCLIGCTASGGRGSLLSLYSAGGGVHCGLYPGMGTALFSRTALSRINRRCMRMASRRLDHETSVSPSRLSLAYSLLSVADMITTACYLCVR